ncbi:SsrA-binding protein SmpB [Kallipyga massiliensis]|uniref:SsrA-binding protein SmpB n=1 Tax=Kallipyga massiliensis TaxID=1472764 RepID=UPI0004B3750C|nr:SsrA-binding protein SmpB [Kallipyga massiliensis]
MAKSQEGTKRLADNRRARHEYFIEESFEAGLSLQGTEVKSIKAGQVSIKEAYVSIKDGEAWMEGMHVTPYKQGRLQDQDPLRPRRLLLHKKEIQKLYEGVQKMGYTIVPLNIHLRNGLVKADIALAKGKKLYDKRESLRRGDDRRRAERAMKNYR